MIAEWAGGTLSSEIGPNNVYDTRLRDALAISTYTVTLKWKGKNMRETYFHPKEDAKRVSLVRFWLVFGSVLLLTVLLVTFVLPALTSSGDPIWPVNYGIIPLAVLHCL